LVLLQKQLSNHWMEPKCYSEHHADVLNDISVDTCDKQSRGLLSGYLIHQKEETQSAYQWEKGTQFSILVRI